MDGNELFCPAHGEMQYFTEVHRHYCGEQVIGAMRKYSCGIPGCVHARILEVGFVPTKSDRSTFA